MGMKQEYSNGVIVFHREEGGGITYLLVQGYGGYWGFPKGRREKNERKIDTALRELDEETAVKDVHILKGMCFDETYTINKKRGPNIAKHVSYFVGEAEHTRTKRQRSEIRRLGWFPLELAMKRVVPEKKSILKKVDNYLRSSR